MVDIPLPDYRLSTGSFELQEPVSGSQSAKGLKTNLTVTIDPFWTFEAETMPLWDDERRIWTVWKNKLRGGLVKFTAYDITRDPLAYPGAQSASDISAGWDGTGTAASLDASGELEISGLPSGYQLKAGDRVGIEAAAGHLGYYEAVEDASANGSGVLTAQVAPFISTTLFSAGDTVRLWRPKCRFTLDSSSFSSPTIGPINSVSFRAMQQVMA